MADYLSKLSALVDTAKASPDLFKIVSLIPTELMKEALRDALQALAEKDGQQIKKIYYETAPLADIIPSDVVQSILSFNPLSASQGRVCKHFKALIHQNDKLQNRKKKDIVNKYEIAPQWVKDPTRRSLWVADDSRDELTNEEFQLGCKGMLDLSVNDDDFDLCESGDMVYVYGKISVYLSSFNEKKLSFIGMDDDAEVYFETEAEIDRMQKNLYLYFENVIISVAYWDWESLEVSKSNNNSNMWFKNCDIRAPIEIADVSCRFCFKNCQFSPTQKERVPIRMDIPPKPKIQQIEIIGCTFVQCGDLDREHEQSTSWIDRGCVSFFANLHQETDLKGLSYKIIGNTFKDNPGRSVLFHNIDNNIDFNDPYYRKFVTSAALTMKCNRFEGVNARLRPENEAERTEDLDPDKIYFSVHEW